MVFLQRTNASISAPGYRARAWLLAIALLVAGLSSEVPGAAAGAYGGGSGGGDAIGSLPGTYGGPAGTDPTLASALPVLVIRGTPAELKRLIVDASGSGSVEQISVADGVVEYLFHGNVSVWLDKGVLASSSVSVRIEVNPLYGSHVAKIAYDGQPVSRSLRAAVDMPIALAAMLALPKVSAGAQVTLALTNAKHLKQVFGIQDQGAWVRLDQRF